jgi:hypothetical protein
MKFSEYLILGLPIVASAHPIIVEHTKIPNRRIQTHEDPIHTLHPRDSVTIDLKNSFSNITVSNSQNKAKFKIINNAKNSNIAMGDQSNHTANFQSFGDKNMLNSTGSNTRGWNTKNHDSNLTTGGKAKRKQKIFAPKEGEQVKRVGRYRNLGVKQTKDGYRNDGNVPRTPGAQRLQNAANCEPGHFSYLAEQCVPTSRQYKPTKSNSTESALDKRAQVSLNLSRNAKNSNLTQSGNSNDVGVFVAGQGDNIVNITVGLEADNSVLEDSNNKNTVKVYIGERNDFDCAIPLFG